MMTKVSDFDLSLYLDDKEIIAEYLTQVLNDGDFDEFYDAISYIAKARGMSKVSQDTGLGRESLYKSFKKGSKPKFETVLKVFKSLDIKLKVIA
ncbi:addiction module antidote protein [Arcobacter arenosus]|uniref:addiction module antidote protein n=1 Tax=Arcobacter arenosus TaxID=2576037 RepID=UPI003BA87CE7